MKKAIFRIDDIGASTKHFNQHGKKFFYLWRIKFYFPFSNFWFLKRVWPFKAWAPYEELNLTDWQQVLKVFSEYNIVPIIAITATWVDKQNNLIPFNIKFPAEAELLKQAFRENKIIIANHGLTHCVVGKHLPSFWSSNRNYHREFLPELSLEIHKKHILDSQKILEDFFGRKIEIFVPPGNLWSIKTYQALLNTNIKQIMSKNYMADSDLKMSSVDFISDASGVVAFHDREIKLFGINWLRDFILKNNK